MEKMRLNQELQKLLEQKSLSDDILSPDVAAKLVIEFNELQYVAMQPLRAGLSTAN